MVKKDKKVKKSKKKVQQLPASVKALLQYMGGTSATIGNYPVKGKATETAPLETLIKFLTSQPAYQAQAQQQSFKEDVKRVIEEERKAREEQTKMLKESQEQLLSRYEGTVYGGESKSQMRALEEQIKGLQEQTQRLADVKGKPGRPTKQAQMESLKELESLREAQEPPLLPPKIQRSQSVVPIRELQYLAETTATKRLAPAEATTIQQAITPSTQQIQSSGYSATLPKAETASPEITRPTPQSVVSFFSKRPSKEEQPQTQLTRFTTEEEKSKIARETLGSNAPQPTSRSEIIPSGEGAKTPPRTIIKVGRPKSSGKQ